MPARVHISHLEWKDGRVAYLQVPPTRENGLKPVALPGAIAIGYTGQRNAVVRSGNGRTATRDVSPGALSLTGGEPVEWLRTDSPAEVVEISASIALRRAVAGELRAEAHADLADLHGWENRQAWAIVDRFRWAARGVRPLVDLERDALVRRLYGIILREKFGARPAEPHHGALDVRRLHRVLDFVEAHLTMELTLSWLAETACLSTYHFARAFKAATGLAPHQYVTARRLELARLRIQTTSESIEAIAQDVGYSNISHFRRQFRARIGSLPFEVRTQTRGGKADPSLYSAPARR